MASACVNGVTAPPEPFLDRPRVYSSYGWLSPRASFSRDQPPESNSKATGENGSSTAPTSMGKSTDGAGEDEEFLDFEFRLGDPATMMTADELFSNGKLVPLQMAGSRPSTEMPAEMRSPERRRALEAPVPDVYAMSPRAPTCSSRWRELLRLRKLRSSNAKSDSDKTTTTAAGTKNSSSTSGSGATRSLKHLLHRNTKSTSFIEASLMNLPLLRDDYEASLSVSSRLSHSSSSSSSAADHDELPRLSLDADKQCSRNQPRQRISRQRSDGLQPPAAGGRVGRSTARRSATTPVVPPPRSASVDSPRMNSSGKVIFQGLGRSSSSPSSFNGGGGGQRVRYRGMEFTPVLNVPVFGLSQLFSAQKKEKERETGSSIGSAAPTAGKGSSRVRIERERSLGN